MSNSLLPTSGEMSLMKETAKTAVFSGFLAEAYNTQSKEEALYKAMYVVQKGHEVGMKPMQALNSINVIKGKPTLSAEGMLALIYANCPGVVINYAQNDNEACKIEAIKPGHKPSIFSFSIEDATKAGLASGHSWKKYTRAMLRSRCVSEMARALFPECISGISYTPEEMGAAVDFTEDGQEKVVIDVSPKEEPKAQTPAQREVEAAFQKVEEIRDPGDYIVKFGKDIKNKALKDIGESKINDVLKWIGTLDKVGSGLKEFQDFAGKYLKQIADPIDVALGESTPPPEEPFPQIEDDNPFADVDHPPLEELPNFAPEK